MTGTISTGPFGGTCARTVSPAAQSWDLSFNPGCFSSNPDHGKIAVSVSTGYILTSSSCCCCCRIFLSIILKKNVRSSVWTPTFICTSLVICVLLVFVVQGHGLLWVLNSLHDPWDHLSLGHGLLCFHSAQRCWSESRSGNSIRLSIRLSVRPFIYYRLSFTSLLPKWWLI